MARQKIYAIEDDTGLQEVYSYSLENEFNCKCFSDGAAFFEALAQGGAPDLVLLDIMLPGEDGFEILARLKNNKTTARIPAIMVSAKGEEVTKVRGLNLGADDYIAKPFGVLELVARIKANLRRTGNETGGLVAYKNISVDHARRSVTVSGTPVTTTLKEYDLLRLLCENPDEVQTREKIFCEVWGSGFIGETRTLDIHIKELRKKLSAAASEAEIKTIRGVGYMLA